MTADRRVGVVDDGVLDEFDERAFDVAAGAEVAVGSHVERYRRVGVAPADGVDGGGAERLGGEAFDVAFAFGVAFQLSRRLAEVEEVGGVIADAFAESLALLVVGFDEQVEGGVDDVEVVPEVVTEDAVEHVDESLRPLLAGDVLLGAEVVRDGARLVVDGAEGDAVPVGVAVLPIVHEVDGRGVAGVDGGAEFGDGVRVGDVALEEPTVATGRLRGVVARDVREPLVHVDERFVVGGDVGDGEADVGLVHRARLPAEFAPPGVAFGDVAADALDGGDVAVLDDGRGVHFDVDRVAVRVGERHFDAGDGLAVEHALVGVERVREGVPAEVVGERGADEVVRVVAEDSFGGGGDVRERAVAVDAEDDVEARVRDAREALGALAERFAVPLAFDVAADLRGEQFDEQFVALGERVLALVVGGEADGAVGLAVDADGRADVGAETETLDGVVGYRLAVDALDGERGGPVDGALAVGLFERAALAGADRGVVADGVRDRLHAVVDAREVADREAEIGHADVEGGADALVSVEVAAREQVVYLLARRGGVHATPLRRARVRRFG